MHRMDFGQLVAALRQDLGWTQFKLAEAAEIDEAVVSQVERGVKRFLPPDLLFSLANALQLTTLERREFFLAASGLDQKEIVRQALVATTTDVFNARKTLDKMLELVAHARLPTFLTDAYSDVISANQIAVAFFHPSPSVFEGIEKIPGGYNTTRFNFGKDLQAREMIEGNWEAYALNSMRSFRVNSLRYRATPYFKYLMQAFRNPANYPFFDRFWKMVSSVEQDQDVNTDYFAIRHRDLGEIKYGSSGTVSITAFGELNLVHYIPFDEQTSRAFEQLAQETGQGAVNFSPWPQKNMP
ncbi:MAG: helix-turn-helix domain-containing protein [Anaerolineales bacterium]|nr:helix-turn-helix domain-containing protein [Anaerolineales bacterium]